MAENVVESGVVEPEVDVLIVEDDPLIIDALGMGLDMDGLSFKVVPEGNAAIKFLEKHNPKSIVFDIHTSHGMDGHQLLANLEADEKLNRIQRTIITGDPRGIDSEKEFIMTKPFNLNLLMDRINSVVHLTEGTNP